MKHTTMKAIKHRLLTLLLLLHSTAMLTGQFKDKTKFFCPDNDFRRIGFFAGAGATNSIATTANSEMEFTISETTGYQATLNANGKWGQSIEAGVFYIPQNGWIRLIELGLGYKNVRGEELVEAVRNPGGDLSFPDNIISQGEFNYSRIAIRLNAQTVTLLGSKTYFYQGPGLTIDKTVLLKESFDIPHLGLVDTAPNQSLILSLNYAVGIGLKLTKGKFLDLYIHTPVVSTGAAIKGSKELIYSSAYKNFTVGIRYKWLKATPSRLCPAFDSRSKDRKVVKKKSTHLFGQW